MKSNITFVKEDVTLLHKLMVKTSTYIFLISILIGCGSSERIRIYRCWTDNMDTYSSVTFDDSLKVEIPFDTVYLSLAFPARTNFYVKYLTSSSLHETMIIKAFVDGEHVYGKYVEPKDTFIWQHDSLKVFFDYKDVRLSSYTWLNKDTPKETFIVQDVELKIPMNKTIKYLEN